jgi:hypothetical protein
MLSVLKKWEIENRDSNFLGNRNVNPLSIVNISVRLWVGKLIILLVQEGHKEL